MNGYYPNTFNFNLAMQKGLTNYNKLSEKYIELYNKYNKYFLRFMIDILDLNMYDKLIGNSELDFGICRENRQDVYQKSSPLNYIYIKNNLHIEKLSDNDLRLLDVCNDDNILLDLIRRTYKEIITINCINNKMLNNNFSTQMFPNFYTNSTILPNDALIIVIREGDAKEDLTGEEFWKNAKLKNDFIEDLIAQMKKEIEKKLDCNVEFVHLYR